MTFLIRCFLPQMCFYGFTALAGAFLERAPPVRGGRVRAGAQQRRRRLHAPRVQPARGRSAGELDRRLAHPGRRPGCSCCSAWAPPPASRRWRSCSSPPSRVPAPTCASCSTGATRRCKQRRAALGMDGRRTSSRTRSRCCSCWSSPRPGDAGNVSAYQYAFIFFQLPHGLFAVSIMTTTTPGARAPLLRRQPPGHARRLHPRPALHAPGRGPVRASASRCSRSPRSSILVRGGFDASDATVTADTLQAFALGLVPFSVYLYTLRGFYAQQDTRTPFLVNAFENGVQRRCSRSRCSPRSACAGSRSRTPAPTCSPRSSRSSLLTRRIGDILPPEVIATAVRSLDRRRRARCRGRADGRRDRPRHAARAPRWPSPRARSPAASRTSGVLAALRADELRGLLRVIRRRRASDADV